MKGGGLIAMLAVLARKKKWILQKTGGIETQYNFQAAFSHRTTRFRNKVLMRQLVVVMKTKSKEKD